MTHGEILPEDTQAILRDNSEAARLLRKADLSLDRFMYEAYLARKALGVMETRNHG